MIYAILICLAPVATDGDTLRCAHGERIRIFGIQAPETGQPGAAESTANLGKLSTGGLNCEIVGASYSRLVGRCENAQGQDVGREQLKAGFATEWCSYSRGYYGTCP